MPIPVRHLLAGSAVASLLFLLPMRHVNAQDNRDNWAWDGTRAIASSFVAGGTVGSIASWLLLQGAFKGKRDNEKVDTTLTRFDQLDSSVNILNGMVTKLEMKLEEKIHETNHTLKNKMDFGSTMNTINVGLQTIQQHILKVEKIIEETIKEKKSSQIEQPHLPPSKTIENYNNQPRPIIIDTCAIIDGRIIGLLEFDFFQELKGHIIIADCVLKELEAMNKYKLECHNLGYKNLYRLSRSMSHRIEEKNTSSDCSKSVDEKLLQLTIDTNGILVTMDGGLIKLCHSNNVQVLNLNDLRAVVRKPRPLIGSMLKVRLNEQEEKYSKERPNSAIASIDDQLVVVEDGKPHIGQKKSVTIIGWSDSDTGPVFAKLSSPGRQSSTVEPPTIL